MDEIKISEHIHNQALAVKRIAELERTLRIISGWASWLLEHKYAVADRILSMIAEKCDEALKK